MAITDSQSHLPRESAVRITYNIILNYATKAAQK